MVAPRLKVLEMRGRLQKESQKRDMLKDQEQAAERVLAGHAINEPEFGDRKAEHQALTAKITAIRRVRGRSCGGSSVWREWGRYSSSLPCRWCWRWCVVDDDDDDDDIEDDKKAWSPPILISRKPLAAVVHYPPFESAISQKYEGKPAFIGDNTIPCKKPLAAPGLKIA